MQSPIVMIQPSASRSTRPRKQEVRTCEGLMKAAQTSPMSAQEASVTTHVLAGLHSPSKVIVSNEVGPAKAIAMQRCNSIA